jgi:hypothetical protein
MPMLRIFRNCCLIAGLALAAAGPLSVRAQSMIASDCPTCGECRCCGCASCSRSWTGSCKCTGCKVE